MDQDQLDEAIELINKSDKEQSYYNDYHQAIQDLRLAVRAIHSYLKDAQLTTVEPTQTAPTTEEPSVAEEPTYLVTRQSSPSAPVDTGSGLVGHNSECVHQAHLYQSSSLYLGKIANCQKCGVTLSLAWIPAQGVGATSSTSVKQPSNESVGNSVEESVKSPSNELTEDQLHWLDVGGEMALNTVKGFIEGRLAIKRKDLVEGTNICRICNKRKSMLQDESICFECSSRSK